MGRNRLTVTDIEDYLDRMAYENQQEEIERRIDHDGYYAIYADNYSEYLNATEEETVG